MLGILKNFGGEMGKPVGNVSGNGHERVRSVAVKVYPIDRNPIHDDRVYGAVGKRTFDADVVPSLDEVGLSEMGHL